jgi:hypothetical protein
MLLYGLVMYPGKYHWEGLLLVSDISTKIASLAEQLNPNLQPLQLNSIKIT